MASIEEAEQEVRRNLRRAFPNSRLSSKVPRLSHEQYVEMRNELCYMMAEDTLFELPGILDDLLENHAGSPNHEKSDMVIIFLDVISEDRVLADQKLRDSLDEFVKSVDPEMADAVRNLVSIPGFFSQPASEQERERLYREDRASREGYFELFTPAQCRVVFDWLFVARHWNLYSRPTMQSQLARAMLYWRSRAEGKGKRSHKPV